MANAYYHLPFEHLRLVGLFSATAGGVSEIRSESGKQLVAGAAWCSWQKLLMCEYQKCNMSITVDCTTHCLCGLFYSLQSESGGLHSSLQ
jgi:hypothetical protein